LKRKTELKERHAATHATKLEQMDTLRVQQYFVTDGDGCVCQYDAEQRMKWQFHNAETNATTESDSMHASLHTAA